MIYKINAIKQMMFGILFEVTGNVVYITLLFKDIQTSLTLFFALSSKLIVYKCIKYILHHAQK